MVLYIHSGFHDYPHEIQGMVFNIQLQKFISGMLGRCAVPLFYVISGYLFFQNMDNRTILWHKIKKRIRTLIVPYLIAACFFPLFYIIMGNIPGTGRFINSDDFTNQVCQSMWQILCSLFYDAGNGSPFAFHLWFLRDLIIIIACSPLLYYIKKVNRGGMLLIILLLLDFCHIKYIPVYALLWFWAGALFLMSLGRMKSMFFPVLFILISIIELFVQSSVWEYLQIPIIALGLVSIWNLYDKLVSKSFNLENHNLSCVVCQYTFFIYLFHEPSLNIVRKLLILILGRSSLGFAINYLVSPWIFVVLFVILGFYFKKYSPRIYSICVGGR